MDREREQFFPERGIVKKPDYCDVNNFGLRSQLQKRNWSGEFLSPQKGGNSGKKGSVILAGWEVSCQNSYQVWTMLELLSVLEPYLELLYCDGLWVHLNMIELGEN
jgi:hypothetical protein